MREVDVSGELFYLSFLSFLNFPHQSPDLEQVAEQARYLVRIVRHSFGHKLLELLVKHGESR